MQDAWLATRMMQNGSCLHRVAALDIRKIDRSFMLDLLTNQNDAVIARNIIARGRNRDLRALVESVETVAQGDFLFEHGCDAYLGAQALAANATTSVVWNA